MLLADLPYSKEAASGCKYVSFFHYESPDSLKETMLELLSGRYECLHPVDKRDFKGKSVTSWEELIYLLLK